MRCHERVDGDTIGRERRTGVEAEPPEPEHPRAKQRERHIVRHGRHAFEVASRAEHLGQHQRRDPGADMHDRATGEIQRAQGTQPAAVAPDPVCKGIIDQRGPDQPEREVRHEAHAIDDRAGEERDRDAGEHRLKRRKEQMWQRRRVCRIRNGGHPLKSDKSKAADPVRARTEREAVAEEHPLHCDNGQRPEAHQHGVERALAAHETTVKERQSRHHEQHEGRGNHYPCGITRGDRGRLHQ